MLLQALEEWTAGLSDEDRTCAVAALAVLGFDASRKDPIIEAYRSDPPASFRSEARFDEQLRRGEAVPAAELAQAWKDFISTRPFLARVCVRVTPEDPSFPALVDWLQRVLGHRAALASLFFHPRGLERQEPAWRWPLRVGVPEGPEGEALFEACRRAIPPGLRHRVALQEPSTHRVEHDVLLVPPVPDLEVALVRLARHRATVVMAGGPVPVERWPGLMAMFHASAMTAVKGDVAWHLRQMVSRLEEGSPLDVALSYLAYWPARPPVLLADPLFVQASRLGERPQSKQSSQPRPPPAPPRESGAGPLPMTSEPPAGGPSPAPSRPARWVQARVLEASPENVARIQQDSRAEVPLARRFIRRQPHLVGIHIGAPLAGALRPDQPLPEEQLRFLRGEETLGVVVIAPGCAVAALPPERPSWAAVLERIERGEERSERALNTLLLPRHGDSSVAWFALRPEGDRVEARLLVAHRNRVLQTLLLEGPAAAGKRRPPSARIKLTAEAMVYGGVQPLSERRGFDAALVVDGGAAGKPRLAWIAGQRVELSDLEDARGVFNAISDQLARLCDEGEDFGRPGSEALRTLLVDLANLGVALRRRIVEDTALGEAVGDPGQPDRSAPSRFQIVSAAPEAILPLELVYDGDAPGDAAPLCPEMAAALAAGSCAACPRRASREVVCPVRFWGLSKVIERNAYARSRKGDPEFAVLVEPREEGRRFPEPGSAVFAYSDRAAATSTAREALAGVVNRLEKLTGKPCAPLRSWTDWRTAVEERKPSVLALVPHTEPRGGVAAIEIATGELLRATQVTRTEVGTRTPRLAVLFGCSTADPKMPFVAFPANLRHAGVEVIIGTLSPVLGRHAAPALAELIDHLAQAWAEEGPTPLAELMARFRREQMSAGLPFGMAVVAYGDADWTFGR